MPLLKDAHLQSPIFLEVHACYQAFVSASHNNHIKTFIRHSILFSYSVTRKFENSLVGAAPFHAGNRQAKILSHYFIASITFTGHPTAHSSKATSGSI